MQPDSDASHWRRGPLALLPLAYVAAVALTYALSMNTPGGAYYRLIAVNPIAGAPMMVVENDVLIVGIFLVTGVPWWFLVGLAGLRSWNRHPSLGSRVIGALISLSTFLACTSLALSVLKEDLQSSPLPDGVIIQYLLIGILCLGAFTSTVLATFGGWRRSSTGGNEPTFGT